VPQEQGNTFQFMSALARTIPQDQIAQSCDGKRRRVLYAEDQVSSRIVTKAMLERMGFEVEAVDDGEVAVERARLDSYDIVLLDIEMPVMDGVTAARTIRGELASYKNTPILALSAFLADSTEHSPWRDAFDTAVPKPANSNELRSAMAHAFERHAKNGIVVQTAQKESLWKALSESLPSGTRRMIIEAAADEMHHMALAMAAAIEAGDVLMLPQFRAKLESIAGNFGLHAVQSRFMTATDDIRKIDTKAIFQDIQVFRTSMN
jgi:CheY-like chemotaxis protein